MKKNTSAANISVIFSNKTLLGGFIFKSQWDKEACYYHNYVILFWKFKPIHYYIKREKEA